ncbi:MAG: hypothetical protein U0599_07150 [Vicinamibacteria bacterium]
MELIELVKGFAAAAVDWMSKHQAVVSVCIAVAGWLASHVFTIRAQRRSFENQIRNDARKYIGEALRDYEDWCSTAAKRLSHLRFPQYLLVESSPPEKRREEVQGWSDLLGSKAAVRWEFAIEESEILFPELKRPRQQLHDYHVGLLKELRAQVVGLRDSSPRPDVSYILALEERLRQQNALAAYLQVSVDNIALGQIVGRKRRVPRPYDSSLPRLVVSGKRLEFAPGKPSGRFALAWRTLRHGRFRAIPEDDLPDQKALAASIGRIAASHRLDAADVWVQGEGQSAAVQFLDAKSGRERWWCSGAPETIRAEFEAWAAREETLMNEVAAAFESDDALRPRPVESSPAESRPDPAPGGAIGKGVR